jgi:hypothetical protein
MPQERYNAQWVRDNGLGVVHDSFRTIRTAVVGLVERLPEYRRNLRACGNRAVFEVPEILARILPEAAVPADSAPVDGACTPQAVARAA